MNASTARRLAMEHLRQTTIRRRIAQARVRAAQAQGVQVVTLPQLLAAMTQPSSGVRQVLEDIRNDLDGVGEEPGPAKH